jgi:CHRD domain
MLRRSKPGNLCGTPGLPACVSGTGVLVSGSNGITEGGITFDSLLSAMRTGGAYVNVHTSDGDAGPGDFPNGEIRGQIDAQ